MAFHRSATGGSKPEGPFADDLAQQLEDALDNASKAL